MLGGSTSCAPECGGRSTPGSCRRASSRWRGTGGSPPSSPSATPTLETRYVIFSATKAFVASAAWLLIGEGSLDIDRRVAEYIPEFATNGKDVVTVEQVMLHTSGFPRAPLGPPALGRP